MEEVTTPDFKGEGFITVSVGEKEGVPGVLSKKVRKETWDSGGK